MTQNQRKQSALFVYLFQFIFLFFFKHILLFVVGPWEYAPSVEPMEARKLPFDFKVPRLLLFFREKIK